MKAGVTARRPRRLAPRPASARRVRAGRGPPRPKHRPRRSLHRCMRARRAMRFCRYARRARLRCAGAQRPRANSNPRSRTPWRRCGGTPRKSGPALQPWWSVACLRRGRRAHCVKKRPGFATPHAPPGIRRPQNGQRRTAKRNQSPQSLRGRTAGAAASERPSSAPCQLAESGRRDLRSERDRHAGARTGRLLRRAKTRLRPAEAAPGANKDESPRPPKAQRASGSQFPRAAGAGSQRKSRGARIPRGRGEANGVDRCTASSRPVPHGTGLRTRYGQASVRLGRRTGGECIQLQ